MKQLYNWERLLVQDLSSLERPFYNTYCILVVCMELAARDVLTIKLLFFEHIAMGASLLTSGYEVVSDEFCWEFFVQYSLGTS